MKIFIISLTDKKGTTCNFHKDAKDIFEAIAQANELVKSGIKYRSYLIKDPQGNELAKFSSVS